MSFSRDWDLKQRLINFLRMKGVMRRQNVRIDVTQGLVTLSGQVRSFYEKQLFISACQRVAGVISIVDDIDVVGSAQWSEPERSTTRATAQV